MPPLSRYPDLIPLLFTTFSFIHFFAFFILLHFYLFNVSELVFQPTHRSRKDSLPSSSSSLSSSSASSASLSPSSAALFSASTSTISNASTLPSFAAGVGAIDYNIYRGSKNGRVNNSSAFSDDEFSAVDEEDEEEDEDDGYDSVSDVSDLSPRTRYERMKRKPSKFIRIE